MPHYRAKPEIVDAMQYTGENKEIIVHWADSVHVWITRQGNLLVTTVSGPLWVNLGDWILKKGDSFRVLNDYSFNLRYEESKD